MGPIRTIILLLFLSVPQTASAAIAYVQGVSASGIGVSSLTTGSITTTNGNLLICTATAYAGSLFLITDSKSNSYTDSITEQVSSADANTHLRQQYVNNATGGATHNFTYTFNITGDVDLGCIEVSGQATSNVLDKTATKIDNPNGTSQTSSSTATTAQNDELLVGAGMLGAFFCECTFTAGGSFTARVNITADFGVTVGQIVATRVVSVSGAYEFPFTTNASETGAIGAISTWKAAATVGASKRRIITSE